MPGVDQIGHDAVLLQQLIKRHPIDPGRLQGDCIDAAGDQPGDECQQVRSKGAEDPHRLWITIRWDGDDDLIRADINPCCIGKDGGQPLHMQGLGGTAVGGHGNLLAASTTNHDQPPHLRDVAS